MSENLSTGRPAGAGRPVGAGRPAGAGRGESYGYLKGKKITEGYKPGDPILRGINLSKKFLVGEGVVAVREVSLEVKPGEFILVVGPSGCGKSTLLSLLGGLDRPSAGEVLLEGRKYSRLDENGLARLRRSSIGFVFQLFNLLGDLTSAENVSLPMRLIGLKEDEIHRRTEDLLAAVGMLERANHSPYELSGGEQQRVAVARALANQPKVVLADEPTGNLDRKNGLEVIKLFKRFNKERGQTFIVVTHDQSFAEFADRVVHMEDGRILKVEGGVVG